MKKTLSFFFCIIFLFLSGCTVNSAIRKGLKTAYETIVDERSISQVIKDKKLTALIMADILEDDLTNVLDITVKCYFGFPFITGQCNTLEEAGRIVEIAKKISGKPVVPYLVKKGKEEDECNIAINLKITTEINTRLIADKKIFASNIYVKSVNCTAVIMGVVGSNDTIKAILKHAKSTVGVKDIRSFIVSTGTNRSWDSVFKTITEMARETEEAMPSEHKP